MKLNDKFLAVRFALDLPIDGTGTTLRRFFLSSHLNPGRFARYRDSLPEDQRTEAWEVRERNAIRLADQPKGMQVYYLTPKVQDEAGRIKRSEKVDLQWFRQMRDMECIYVTSKDEFYRISKSDDEVRVLYYVSRKRALSMDEIIYDTYRISLTKGVSYIADFQDKAAHDRLINLMLFVELGEVQYQDLRPGGKVVYGKGGDDKVLNEAGLVNAKVVTTKWNTIFNGTVSGHIKMVAYGERHSLRRLQYIPPYPKGKDREK